MATFDAPYLLSKFNAITGRPTTDGITAAEKYQRLTDAYNELVGVIAGVCPNVLYPKVAYGSMPTLTTSDNQVFTFGADANGYAIAPMGKTGIYPDLTSIPDMPWREGVDYLNEGTQIRIPNNNTWTGTLYWRGITPPADIDATHDPALFPEASRMLIPHIAALNFGTEYTRNLALVQQMQRYLGEPWAPTGTKGAFSRWCLTWRTQFRQGGALGTGLTGMQLAIAARGVQWMT